MQCERGAVTIESLIWLAVVGVAAAMIFTPIGRDLAVLAQKAQDTLFDVTGTGF